MLTAGSVLVHRGKAVSLPIVHGIAAEILGGHVRPDAALLVSASAPVRVDRDSRGQADPLEGTVRVLHFATPDDCDSLYTDLSRIVLRPRFGFPEDVLDTALDHFGAFGLDPLALRLSEESGPVAALYLEDDGSPLGGYSVFGHGRRLWSAVYRPDRAYATWDGRELIVTEMSPGDPAPPEGDYTDFPAHGLQLLFGRTLPLTHAERFALLPSLERASRPPTEAAAAMHLVQDGRFVPLGREADIEDLDRYSRSFSG